MNWQPAIFAILMNFTAGQTHAVEEVPLGTWETYSPREELKPTFSRDQLREIFSIQADHRHGLHGGWRTEVEVVGG
ncbi:MAG: hypothetical protein VX470_11650, partial [Planctomycetota bacterium]|nr:hypothetical protein [Planctomycetota bacterium]